MWNNISTLAEKRTGMEGLNSTYYNLIAKKPITTVRPLRAYPLPESVNSTDVEEDKDTNVTASQPDETFVRQNRHKRTRPPEQVRPRTNPDSAAVTDGNTSTAISNNSQFSAAEPSSPGQLSYSQARLQNDLTKLSQESGTSQGINNAHSFPRDKLPYSPPSLNNLIEDQPEKVVTRAQSQPFTGIHSRMVAEILQTPTRSDFRNILGQRSSFHTLTTATKPKPRASPNQSESDDSFVSSRSVFDVEEDSKFEFYVEDQESDVKTSPKEDLGSTEIQGIPIPTSVCSKNSDKMELNGHHDSEIQPKEIQIEDKVPEIAANVTTTNDNDPDYGESSLIFYSNPRYGSRYACKDTDVINSVVQRNYAPTEDSIPEEITTYGIKSKRHTASAKLYKEMSERLTLKPVRRCYSAYAPPDDTESVEDMDDVAKQQKSSPKQKKTSYKDSTQFLFPPVLSESSFTSIPSKRKSRESDIEDEDEDNDYEAPDPDMKAIREYNIKLVQGEKNTSAPTSSDASSLTHRRVGGCDGSSGSGLLEDVSGSRRFPVRSRSSIVTNIPCDSWMMFPLRVLPGGMVPWGLLLFVPLILILVVVLGYFAVTLFPFKMT